MKLKTKITLTQKGQEAFLVAKQLMIKLKWASVVDLDLLAFYKAKDGRVGGVYSDHYAGGSLGNLNNFPFIQLGNNSTNEKNERILRIIKFDDIAELYICALNFNDFSKGKKSAFNTYKACIEIIDVQGRSFDVPLNSMIKSTIAIIVKVDNTNLMGAKLINKNDITPLDDFARDIPCAKNLKIKESDQSSENSDNNTLPVCKFCKKIVSPETESCPQCGQPDPLDMKALATIADDQRVKKVTSPLISLFILLHIIVFSSFLPYRLSIL